MNKFKILVTKYNEVWDSDEFVEVNFTTLFTPFLASSTNKEVEAKLIDDLIKRGFLEKGSYEIEINDLGSLRHRDAEGKCIYISIDDDKRETVLELEEIKEWK